MQEYSEQTVASRNPFATTFLLPLDLPLDSIAIWSGTLETIPAGWRICDGTCDTPDLRDKFVKGAGTPNETGGADTHTHDDTYLANRHNAVDVTPSGQIQAGGLTRDDSQDDSDSFTTDPTSHLPTYYSLIYIKRFCRL